jgi:hypothetical protein
MRNNLAGRKFGRLTVKQKYDVIGKGETRWLCDCDCGNKNVPISRGSLISGNTKSCGCFQKEMVYITKKKYNEYDLSGEYGVGYTSNTNKEFYFDLEDYDLIKEYCWYENDSGYIVSRMSGGKNIRQHRLILKILDKGETIIDHINTIKHDNRKANLRFANKQTNGINRKCNKNNKLGVKGIHEKNGKYYPKVMKDGKSYYIGTFNNLKDAIEAHFNKSKELFGEFAFVEEKNSEG